MNESTSCTERSSTGPKVTGEAVGPGFQPYHAGIKFHAGALPPHGGPYPPGLPLPVRSGHSKPHKTQDSSLPHRHFSGSYPEREGRDGCEGPAFHSGVSGYSEQAQCQPGYRSQHAHPGRHASPGPETLSFPEDSALTRLLARRVHSSARPSQGPRGVPVTVGFCPGCR